MSSNSTYTGANETQLIVQEFLDQQYLSQNILYTHLAVTALATYDYFLTLPAEINEIWSGPLKFTLVKILYLLNRYTFVGVLSTMMVAGLWDTAAGVTVHACTILIRLNVTIQTVGYLAIQATFILRTYAIYHQKRWVIFVLLLPSLLWISACIWWIVDISGFLANVPAELARFATCGSQFSRDYYQLKYFAYTSTILWNLAVFILTILRTARLARESMSMGFKSTNSIWYLILRDGILYHAVFLLAASVMLALVALPSYTTHMGDIEQDAESIFLLISDTLQWILVSRLILNLKQSAHITTNMSNLDSKIYVTTGLTEPVFAANSFLGNIGAPLRVGSEDRDIFEHGETEHISC